MKKLLALLFLSTLLSCSSDDSNEVQGIEEDPNTENPIAEVKLLRIENFDAEGNLESEVEYSYNDYGFISAITTLEDNQEYTRSFIYEDDLLMRTDLSWTDQHIDYEYENGVLVSSSTVEGEYFTVNEFEYENGYVVSKTQIDNDVVCCTVTYNRDENGNILGMSNNGFDGEFYNEYDTGNNPLYINFPESYLKISEESPNNLVYSNRDDNDNYRTVSYEYNSNNYPTESITDYYNSNAEFDQSYTTKYYYE